MVEIVSWYVTKTKWSMVHSLQMKERDVIHQQRDRDKDSQARVVYDQASNDRMEQSAKDLIQKPLVKETQPQV